MKRLFLVFLFFIINSSAFTQNLVQTIKGTITDKETNIPLPGAAVIIVGSNPLKGTVSNLDGDFRIEGVLVGRYTLKFSFIGYEDGYLNEVQLNSGKESVLSIGLRPAIIQVNGVEIKAQSSKQEPLNTMATLSARQLNMEEANRYAGGFDDPSRLASSFAGVASNLSSNGIVIRGNSPRGMLWQLEGVPISNPNHFSEVTTFGGGGITALSSQVITNSDFFTGAFPAEYGNALSGVFDLKMRQGNKDKVERTFKVGTIGIDFSGEGPFRKGKQATYLFNYRYSSLALIAPLLPENGGSVRYQDFSIKTNHRIGKSGTLSFWGMGSGDQSGSSAKKDTSNWIYEEDKQKTKAITALGASGLSYKHILSSTTLLSATANIAGNQVKYAADWFVNGQDYQAAERVTCKTWNLNFSSFLSKRFSNHHSNKSGFSYQQLFYNIDIGHAAYGGNMVNTTKGNGNTGFFNAFTQSRIDLSPWLNLNLGLHLTRFSLNGYTGLEPRLGIRWKFLHAQSLSLAYGLHSQMEMLPVYLINRYDGSNSTQPNQGLPFSKGHHLVAGWDIILGEFMHLKTEAYFQYLFDIPVVPGTSFSMLNLDKDWYLDAAFTSTGKGTNYGLDITLERYMSKGYYYLATASVFNSRYMGGDKIWRDTRYNKHLVMNLLGGKEWKVGKQKNDLLGLNARVNLMGGDRMTPPDEAASVQASAVIYKDQQAFSQSKPNVYYVDLTLNYTRNKSRCTSTWSIQLINLLAQQEFNGYRYNLLTDKVEEFREVTLVPNISYKIEF